MEQRIYDMIIIGGGPGGYTAALYAARAGMDTLLIEKLSAGGQMCLTDQIDNYPGFDEGVDGYTLGFKMQAGAERFGAKTLLAEVLSLTLDAPVKTVETSDGTYQARTVVLATGANPRPLGVEHEQERVGRGIHYCAACDGMFFRGKTVAVVGGGNTAAADALLLARLCEKVILIHRRDTLRATKLYHESLMQTPNVEFRWNSAVDSLHFDDESFRGVTLKDLQTGERSELAVDGVFVAVGRIPNVELVRGQLDLDESGYIIADESTRTNLPGVFAVGDVRTKALRQVITAASDGAVAAFYAEEYLAAGE